MSKQYMYYLLIMCDYTLKGPFSFKEAVSLQRTYRQATRILKEVIDENGKEVK